MSLISIVLPLLAFSGVQDRPVAKVTLPNGTLVYARRLEGAKTFSVVLAACALKQTETQESHGIRHLLEHLVAKGPNHDVDALLEGQGMILKAETTRDAVTFEVSGTREQLPTALEAFKRMLSGFSVSADDLAKEVGIMRQEAVLRPWSMLLVSDVWRKAFGDDDLDPFGDMDALAKLTPEALKDAYGHLFDPSTLSCVVAGDINADEAVHSVSEILSSRPEGETVEPTWRLPAKKSEFAGSLDGEAVGAPVGPLTNTETVATLAAAFGLRAWLPGCQVIYTPSARNALVVVTLRTGLGWGGAATRLRGKEALVAVSGLNLLKSWKEEVASSPSLTALTMARVLPFRPGFNFEAFVEALDKPKREDVQRAVRTILVRDEE